MKRIRLVALTFLLVTALFIPAFNPPVASAATFADGEYTVPFTVLQDKSNEVSATADYMVSPAKVQLTNDKAIVTVTLKNSSWWQYFKVQNGGSYSDVQVLSESGDQRVVRFTVSDLTSLVNAKIHIIVTGIPGFEYDNKYDIRFNFNTSSIPAPPVEKPAATPPPAKETKPETPKKTEEKPVQKPAQKPAVQKTDTANKTETVTEKEASKPVTETKDDDEAELTVVNSETASDEETITDDKSADTAETEETAEEADIDLETNDEAIEEDEEEVIEEVAVEEVKEEKEESSNGLFILITVITAVIVASIVFVLARKRARK